MKATSLVLGTLALAVSSAFAAPPANSSWPLTRAEVRQSVLAARAAGELAHAGAAYDGPPPYSHTKSSELTRAQVRSDVMVARALRRLTPAGDGTAYAVPSTTTATRARADVKRQTLQARAAGTLIPAGEGSPGSTAQFARTAVSGG
jgi:hypothetical protein